MVFSDASTQQGIVQLARFYVNADAGTYPVNDITRSINRWYERALTLILKADGVWQYDDINYTNLPIGTTNIVSGQQDYSVNASFLRITKVLMKDNNGLFKPIYQIDQNDQYVRSYLDNNTGNTGTPYRYDIIGNSLFLDPVPNYNSTNGLKVYFQRSVSLFTPSDTTKEPGFASNFHEYLALGAAYDFARKNMLSNLKQLANDIAKMEKEIMDFYAKRNKDRQTRIIPRYVNPR